MRCIVKNCQNHEHEGLFVGSLCSPCHQYITKGEGRYSQAYRNAQRKPLTDVEIWNTYKNLWLFHPAEEPRLAGDVLKFARAIEAAHGIKE